MFSEQGTSTAGLGWASCYSKVSTFGHFSTHPPYKPISQASVYMGSPLSVGARGNTRPVKAGSEETANRDSFQVWEAVEGIHPTLPKYILR